MVSPASAVCNVEKTRCPVSAAETGHLVFSTLHTADAGETINRILEFYEPHEQMQARSMLALDVTLAAQAGRYPDRTHATTLESERTVVADRERAVGARVRKMHAHLEPAVPAVHVHPRRAGIQVMRDEAFTERSRRDR